MSSRDKLNIEDIIVGNLYYYYMVKMTPYKVLFVSVEDDIVLFKQKKRKARICSINTFRSFYIKYSEETNGGSSSQG